MPVAEFADLPTLDEIDAALAKRSPAEFAVVASRGRWKHARHLDLLNEKLLALAAGKIRRLIVTMPPRHGKSELCSKFFPAWFVGKNPENRVILCSYEAGFAAAWGGKARDILEEFGSAFFGVKVREDVRAREDWKIAGHEGGMMTAGVGGAITGKGCQILIIDDPVKNAEQADSKVYREKTWEWWKSTALTRLEPNGSVLVIQTRWHEDDLTGRLLSEQANDTEDEAPEEKWEIFNLPAIAEECDAMGRKKGEALWPERWPAEKLERRRKRFGLRVWYALYQQRPLPPGGAIFKREDFRYYVTNDPLHGDKALIQLTRQPGQESEKTWTVKAKDCRRFMSVDVAASEERSADYTVAQVWGLTPSYDLMLLEQWRAQASIPTVVDNIVRLSRDWDIEFAAVERDGIGLAAVQTLKARGVVVKPIKARGDKVIRATAAQLRFQAEMIHFPLDGGPWVKELCEELESFPRGAHDDQVDALSQMSGLVQQLGGAIPDAGTDAEEKRQADKQADADRVESTPGSKIVMPENGEEVAAVAAMTGDEWLEKMERS